MIDKNLEDAIQTLSAKAYSNSKARGHWEEFPDRFTDERSWLGEKVALAHTELSEMIKADREVITDELRMFDLLGECADTIIRCLDMAYVIMQFDALQGTSMNIGQLIVHKMNTSVTRGYKHGKRW